MDFHVDEVLQRACQPREGYDAEVDFGWCVFPLLNERACDALGLGVGERCAEWRSSYHRLIELYHSQRYYLHRCRRFRELSKSEGFAVPHLEALELAADPPAVADAWREYEQNCSELREHWMSLQPVTGSENTEPSARHVSAIARDVLHRHAFDTFQHHLVSRRWFQAVCPPPAAHEIRHLRQLNYPDYLRTPHWLRRRAAMLMISGMRCAHCRPESPYDGAWTSDLHVHHHSYVARGFEEMADLQVLCTSHHARAHRLLAG